MNRAGDWLKQAKRDLEHAQHSREFGDYEWACFAAQQAAEKALKALHLSQGREVWGHSVLKLVEALPNAPAELFERAKQLDKHYVPPRYPNSYPEGAPADFYTERDADEAIRSAEEVVRYCESHLAGSGQGA